MKHICKEFLDYYNKTALLSFNSTGENHGLSFDEIFDKFLKLHRYKRYEVFIDLETQISELEKENKILVGNNNRLKDMVETLELNVLKEAQAKTNTNDMQSNNEPSAP